MKILPQILAASVWPLTPPAQTQSVPVSTVSIPIERIEMKSIWNTLSIRNLEKIFSLEGFSRDSIFLVSEHIVYQLNVSSGGCSKFYENSADKILALTVSETGSFYLSTSSGLLHSEDGKTWNRIFWPAGSVLKMAAVSGALFAVTETDLYVSESDSGFKKIFSLDSEYEVSEIESEEIEETAEREIILDLTAVTQEKIFVLTTRALYETRDGGRHWIKKTGGSFAGLKSIAIDPILEKFYTVTEDALHHAPLQSLALQRFGLNSFGERLLDVAFNPASNQLAILTGRCLHWAGIDDLSRNAQRLIADQQKGLLLQTLIELEPSIREVQEHVIRYNNAGTGKIDRWQIASRLSALMPSVSFGKDFSTGNSIDLDRGSTSDPDVYIAGPEDISRGWDFDVSWNLSDFIWSSSQTSIDSRSKYNGEWRQELVAEATRLYFERRKIQTYFLFPPETQEAGNLYWDNLIRLEELTAYLDGMTGGFFGLRIQELYSAHPEFETLWKRENGEVNNFSILAQREKE